MKHIFASGEEIYKKNVRELTEGTFTAKQIDYENIATDTVFEAEGTVNGKPAVVRFKVGGDSFPDIQFRFSLKIMMQSDLIQAQWESYEVEYV